MAISIRNENSAPFGKTQVIAQTAAMSKTVKGAGTYHRFPSKQIIKLNKYKAKGSIHRKGTTATS